MAFAFDPNRCSVEYYDLKFGKTQGKSLVAWPFYAYKVLAPRPRKGEINLMQRAVLALCRAGCREPDPISKNLSFRDRELAVLILDELREKEYLNKRDAPTEKGLQVLKDEREEDFDPDDFQVGYVYQDPWSQMLLPRFITEIRPCETVESGKYPSLSTGTKGRPESKRVFWVLHRHLEKPVPPSSREIIKAVKLHSRALRYHIQEEYEGDEEENLSLSRPPVLKKISLLEEGQPVFLATWIYLPAHATTEVDWRVADPFRIGNSLQLRQAVGGRLDENPGLRMEIEHLTKKFKDKLKKMADEYQRAVYEEAEKNLEERFSLAIFDREEFDFFRGLEITYLRIQNVKKPDRNDLDTLLVNGQKLLESLFQSIWKIYEKEQWRKELEARKDRGIESAQQPMQKILKQIAEELGSKVSLKRALSRRKWGDFNGYGARGTGTLRSCIPASLWISYTIPDHPLREAIKQDPEVLHKMDWIAGVRNSSAHASDKVQTVDLIEKVREDCYSIAEIFLPLL